MNAFRRNIPLLAICQALMLSGTSMIVTSASLVGFELAENKSWATLPLAVQFIAIMFTTIPAALLMDRIGRRQGFMLACIFGISGAILAALGMVVPYTLLRMRTTDRSRWPAASGSTTSSGS